MNKPKFEKGDRVYNKCEVNNCLNAGSPLIIGNQTYILCRCHTRDKLRDEDYGFDEWLQDREYDDEPELFDELGDKIVY